MLLGKRLLLYFFLLNQLFGGFWFQKTEVEAYEEEVYLSLRYQGIIDEVIVAYYDGERFFLPLTELFDIFAINYDLDPSSFSVSGYYLKEDMQYQLDFSRFFATMNDQVWQIDAKDFKVKEIDFFVTPNIFKDVFGVGVEVDISKLSIRVETTQELPIIARYTRRYKEELRDRYNKKTSDEDYDLLIDRERRYYDGAFFDYSIYNSISSANKYFNLNLGIGGELLYGDVQANMLSRISQDIGDVSFSDLRWRFVDQSQPWFSTVTLGQQSTVGLINQTYQGVQVTNEPLVPERSYDSYAIDGLTEPEAEVELYQDGRLVEVIKSDDVGYYRFMVPLNYGSSDFKIRIFARQGRVIELDRRIQIPFTFLPVNEVRYAVGSGRLASANQPWRDQQDIVTGNVAMGIKNWLTAGVGLEYLQNNNSDRPVFYGKMSSRVANDVLVNMDIVPNNYYHLALRGLGPNASSYNSEYFYYSKANLYNTRGYVHRFASSIFAPFQYSGMRFTGRGTLGWSYLPGEHLWNFSVDVNQFIQSVRLRYGIKEQHSFSETGHTNTSLLQFGAVYSIPRIPSIHPLIRGSYFRADLLYSTGVGNLDEIRFQYIKQFSRRLKAQALLSYDFIRSNIFTEFGVSWDLDAVRSTSSIRSINSSSSFAQTIRGSVGMDRNNGQFLWDNRQQVGRSGVSVRMFVDDNNSGTYDEGEEVLPGNALSIERSSSRQVTKGGITRLTQLQPYRRYNFRVNESRVKNPMLVARMREFSIITDPNRYKQLDVPFFTTGVIDGRVDKVKDGEYIAISGLRIHIKAVEGDFQLTVRTFGDGSFYSMEIPPGEYEAWVDDAQLEFLRMFSYPEKHEFTIKPSPDGDYIEGLDFKLE